ncbi:MAG: EAL domain-containing protein [Mesotoga sp.]
MSSLCRQTNAEAEETITTDIISMTHKPGHFVSAEGAGNEKQRQFLLSCGCDKIQGYLIARPLNEEIAIEFLESYSKR